MGDHPCFGTKDEEIQYWKELAERFMQDKDYVQREFDDYTADSQQLEKEYEATIEQNEKTIKELRAANNKAQNELESLRLKLEQANKENGALQSEAASLINEKLHLARYIRELEQKNDDLERSERAIGESIAAIETALNLAIERNAILESEIDEKESLKEKLQRLADETRDLKQELQVKEKERCPDNDRRLNGYNSPSPAPLMQIDSNRLRVESETQTTPFKRDPLAYGDIVYDDHSISPSQRVMALNIVGQILRKVGGLESRLNQRTYYHDSRGRTRHVPKGTPPPPTPPSPVHEQTK